MGLENLKSIFQDELNEKVEVFQSNQPIDRFDTKLNYNENAFNEQSFGFSSDLTQRGGRDNPILDAALRGRVYEPIRFSQDFENNNLFVFPEKPPFGVQNISPDSLGLFDPRSTNPKEGTLYFTTNNSFNPATNPTDFSAAGTDGSPFTPLMQLGQGLYNGENNDSNPEINMNWQSLYTNNHKNKPNASWKGLTPVNYGNIVNRDKLNIKNNVNTFRDGIVGEPYIVSNIPRTSNDISSGRVINFGSRDLPIGRLATDTLRITSFLTSPSGLLFIAKQNFLGINSSVQFTSIDGRLKQSRQRFKSAYNPASTLSQTLLRAGGGPLSLLDKSEPDLGDLSSLGINSDFFKSSEYGKVGDTVDKNINLSFTDGIDVPITEGGGVAATAAGAAASLGDQIKDAGNKLKSNLTGEATDVKATSMGGDLFTNIPFYDFGAFGAAQAGLSVEDLREVNTIKDVYRQDGRDTIESAAHGMPFYFKDLRTSAYIFFRAYIEGLTENISPSYASHNYIGRSEPVYTYERAEREISMTLKLVAQTKEELTSIYLKMDRLTSLCYPEYVDEGETGYGNRMKPPLTKLRYGELFGKKNKELMGYIKSISYSIDQSSPYEVEQNKRVPKHVLATIGYQVIHDKVPSIDTKFYGINQ